MLRIHHACDDPFSAMKDDQHNKPPPIVEKFDDMEPHEKVWFIVKSSFEIVIGYGAIVFWLICGLLCLVLLAAIYLGPTAAGIWVIIKATLG